MNGPQAKRVPVQRKAHGVEWVDEFAWLRADNWQECVDDPKLLPADIKAYLTAENDWYEEAMSDTAESQKTLLEEMKGRIDANEVSLPDTQDTWSYMERYRDGQEHPEIWRCPRVEDEALADELVAMQALDAAGKRDATPCAGSSLLGHAQLLLDLNKEAGNVDYFEPGDMDFNPAHTHLAWSADTQGSERYRVTIRDLHTGTDEDVIPDVESIAWGNSRYLFYTRVDADYRASTVYRHERGKPCSEDQLIFEEADNRFSCSVWLSLSSDYLFISTDMDDQSEVWFIPTNDIHAEPRVIEPRTQALEYSVDHQGDRFLILTNADGATDFKLVQAPCATPSRSHWQDWLPHQSGRMVLDHYTYQDWVMWMEREDALPRICYRHNGSADIYRIEFHEEAFALSLEPLLQFDESAFRFGYESPSTPSQTYRFDMATGNRRLLKQECIPSGHDADDYVVRRLQVESLDGERVPVTLLHHKDTALNGSAPCWLTAYGAYGASSPATFSASRLSLINRGFVFALAHVRGGQEKGRAWYEAARFGGKHKSVDDLLSVAEYLIDQRYTGNRKIVLSGGSAGGLLVGAALNRTANCWGAAIADVPFVDALNTMLDDSLPLTPGEWSQWGNPIDDEQAFHDIHSYSPYDNVKAREYPPMLVTAGVSDPRVTYWEPAKWVARHRQMRSDNAPLLLKTNMQSGHFGETGRYASLADVAIEQAFALKMVGVD